MATRISSIMPEAIRCRVTASSHLLTLGAAGVC